MILGFFRASKRSPGIFTIISNMQTIQPSYVEAAHFAAVKHTGQHRKNSNNEPYINHPLEVAKLVQASGVSDPIILCAAVLHDTLEDTETTPEEIQSWFGPEVLRIVEECSDNKELGKVERKIHQIEHARHVSNQAKVVKLADKLSNIGSLGNTPPQGWSEERVKGYVLWGREVCLQMKGVNSWLED